MVEMCAQGSCKKVAESARPFCFSESFVGFLSMWRFSLVPSMVSSVQG